MNEVMRVYQLNPNTRFDQFHFHPFNDWLRAGFADPPKEAYHLAYEGPLTTLNCDEFHNILNLNPPKGFEGNHLSVSDVVELILPGSTISLYCDEVGFYNFNFM